MTEAIPFTREDLSALKALREQCGGPKRRNIDRLIATIDTLTAERDTAYERAAVECDKETDRHSIYSPAQAAMKSAADAIRALSVEE